jgi:hypothetical protein
MTLFARLAVLGFVLIACATGAEAQQAVGLVSGNSFNLYGLHVAISGCTIGLNGASATACTATNKLELLQVASPTDSITFEVIGYTGASPGSTTSAALSATSGLSQLNLTLLVTPNAGYSSNTTRVTGAALTAVGYDAFKSSSGGTTATASAAFSSGTSAAMLTSSLTPQVTTGTPTLRTVSDGPNSFSPNSASFTITENLRLDPHGHTVNLLSLKSVALRFTTTPEPGDQIAGLRRGRNQDDPGFHLLGCRFARNVALIAGAQGRLGDRCRSLTVDPGLGQHLICGGCFPPADLGIVVDAGFPGCSYCQPQPQQLVHRTGKQCFVTQAGETDGHRADCVGEVPFGDRLACHGGDHETGVLVQVVGHQSQALSRVWQDRQRAGRHGRCRLHCFAGMADVGSTNCDAARQRQP